MATLNIKHVPDGLYSRLREMAEREHRSISQQVVHLLSHATARPEPRSILELRGLGKECWGDVDAAEHVKREREEWR